jgi:hypothetical protein
VGTAEEESVLLEPVAEDAARHEEGARTWARSLALRTRGCQRRTTGRRTAPRTLCRSRCRRRRIEPQDQVLSLARTRERALGADANRIPNERLRLRPNEADDDGHDDAMSHVWFVDVAWEATSRAMRGASRRCRR